jgi:TetR/AcrR family transcriptional regulator, cholesterol catabolism regulator
MLKNKRLKRKQQIIEVAAKVFAEKGYHGAALDDIAAELKVTKASLYYYVKNKQQVLEEICEILERDGQAFFHELSESQLNPIEKVRAIVSRQIEVCCANGAITTVYLEVSDALDPKSRSRLRAHLKNVELELQKILQEGTDKGYFSVRDARLASILIFSACNKIPRWYRRGGWLTPQQITDEFITMFEGGFLLNCPDKTDTHPKEYNRILTLGKKNIMEGRFPIQESLSSKKK